jgi:hypothetical protein
MSRPRQVAPVVGKSRVYCPDLGVRPEAGNEKERNMGSKGWGVVLAAAALIAACPAASAQVQPTGTWGPEASGDQFMYGGYATDGTYLYVFGGYQAGVVTAYPAVVAQFRRYDPAGNSWTIMPQMAAGTAAGSALFGVRYHAGAYYGGRLFAFGGQVYTGTVGSASYSTAYSNAIRAFDFSTQTWSTVGATLTAARYYHAAAAMGDRIYIAGGATTNTVDIFDPTANTVAAATPMPGSLYYHTMTAVPAVNKVYAIGGYGVAGYSGIYYEYTPQDADPLTNDAGGSWTTRAAINNNGVQQNLYYCAAITLNNRVYLPGGYNAQTGQISQTYEYSPFTNGWTVRASMAYAHYRHAAVAINGKGYVYGGASNATIGEEFTPPTFGSAPVTPGVTQSGPRIESSLQAQADDELVDGWTNAQVTFSGTVTDPDAGQQIRMRVQVKPASAAWSQASQVASLDTGLRSQGLATIVHNVPAGGAFDWRWRVEDAYGNSHPETPGAWIEAFDNAASPDFRSDQEAPTDPVAVSPHATDVQVTDPVAGTVSLRWQESVGIEYEVQVATDGGFNGIEAQVFAPFGSTEHATTLAVSRYDKFWRVRARDIGGNFSAWSAPKTFRVTHDDGVVHSAGDADKSCGLSAAAGAGWTGGMLGLLLLAGATRRRSG